MLKGGKIYRDITEKFILPQKTKMTKQNPFLTMKMKEILPSFIVPRLTPYVDEIV